MRARIEVPLESDTFDLFFNGRMGYRAQYYLSVEDGAVFNGQIVELLRPVVATAFDLMPKPPASRDIIARSLAGPYSKVWPSQDWTVYRFKPELRPARWTAFWAAQPDLDPSGLKAPVFADAAIDLKGSFLNPDTDQFWDQKPNRDLDIYCRGWT